MQEQFQVGSYHVTVKNRLAEGGFGFVDLVTESHTRKDYVLKRCDVQRQESMDTVKKEISILENFAGPYIVKYLGAEVVTTKVGGHRQALVLLEFCPGGHLLDRLLSRNGSFLPMDVIYRISGQLVMAVHSLHSRTPPTVHRDLKLENVLFGEDGNVRLCDFGSCETAGSVPLRCSVDRANAEEILAKETTQMYRAPEMCDLFLRDELTEKTDIWALGCIFFALCYLIHPFQDCGPLGILNGKMAALPPGADSHVPQEATVVLARMLDMDPEARPTTAQLIEAFSALSRGAPLPPYELSALALQKRAEREEAAVRRANKQTKKTTYQIGGALPPKPTAASAGDVSGAAARRLAAKKGEAYRAPTAAPAASAAFDTDFSAPAATASASFDAGFDAGFSGAAPAASSDNFDPFDTGSSASARAASSDDFGGFGDGGDFGSVSSCGNATAASLFDAEPAGANFDSMFGGGGGGGGFVSPPTPPPTAVRPPTPPTTGGGGGSGDSFFDAPAAVNFDSMFAGGGGSVNPPTPPQSSGAGANSFFDAPQQAEVNFDDMFGGGGWWWWWWLRESAHASRSRAAVQHLPAGERRGRVLGGRRATSLLRPVWRR